MGYVSRRFWDGGGMNHGLEEVGAEIGMTVRSVRRRRGCFGRWTLPLHMRAKVGACGCWYVIR
jgi:hypothetical protein